MRMKLACVPLFVGGCVLLYYGSGMLLLVPGDVGENYLKSLFAGRFLVIVDGEPLVVRPHEHIEEAPRPPSEAAQPAALVLPERPLPRLSGSAHPVRQPGLH